MAIELESLANLPQLQGAANLVARIDALRTDVRESRESLEERLDTIEERLDTIDTRLDTIDTRLAATAHNILACSFNAQLDDDQQALRALHHPVTNAALVGFPGNTRAIAGMNTADLSHLLTQLGEPPARRNTARALRLALRAAIGLKAKVA